MKYTVLQFAVLLAIVGLATAVGLAPTQSRWGAAGLRSMWTAAVICLAAAAAAAIPLTVVASHWPQYLGHAALAGTTIRLVLTATLTVAYQVVATVHLTSFLAWILVLYLALLAGETAVSVVLVRRTCGANAGGEW